MRFVVAVVVSFFSVQTVVYADCPLGFDCRGHGEDGTVYGEEETVPILFPLLFDPAVVAGFGASLDRFEKRSLNAGAGITLLTPGTRHVGLVGGGFVLDFYDHAAYSAVGRDRARDPSGPLGGATAIGFFTFIPLRAGPLTYQFSISGHVRSAGLDRGRIHLVTVDIFGAKRLLEALMSF